MVGPPPRTQCSHLLALPGSAPHGQPWTAVCVQRGGGRTGPRDRGRSRARAGSELLRQCSYPHAGEDGTRLQPRSLPALTFCGQSHHVSHWLPSCPTPTRIPAGAVSTNRWRKQPSQDTVTAPGAGGSGGSGRPAESSELPLGRPGPPSPLEPGRQAVEASPASAAPDAPVVP